MADQNGTVAIRGFNIFDPSSWLPTFGNWGGPGWSAGDRVIGPLTPARIAVGAVETPGADGLLRTSPVDFAARTHDLAYIAATGQANGRKGGTGYFSDTFRGRPRGRNVETSPSVRAKCCCQSGDPNGCWRFTHVRTPSNSCSKSGRSIHCSQSGGRSTGEGSARYGKCRLDHGHCAVCSTKPARTGLRRT